MTSVLLLARGDSSPLPMRKVDSCDVDLNVVSTTYWAGWIMRRILTVTYWGTR